MLEPGAELLGDSSSSVRNGFPSIEGEGGAERNGFISGEGGAENGEVGGISSFIGRWP